jgi:MFS family permease
MQRERNFRWLLMQGSLYNTAVQLTAVSTVLPYIASELDGPPAVVSLLVPLYTAGVVVGTFFASRVFRLARSIVAILVGVGTLQALLVAANAADAAFLPAEVAVYTLLATSAAIGVVTGGSLVVFPIAIAELLSPQRRSDLLLRSAGFGAALIALISVYSALFLSDESPGLDDAELLWMGAAAMALATVCFLALEPGEAALPMPASRMRDVVRDGLEYLRGHRWYQRYLLTQLVFGGVALGSMFFSIYSSESLGLDNGGLDSILVFVSVGLLAGVALWTYVRKHLDTRGMYLCSAGIAAAAAALCLVLRAFHLPPVWTFGVAMLLAAVANQAIYPASQDWIFGQASEDARVVVVSFSQLLMNLGMIPIGFTLGLVASYAPAAWPLGVMLCIGAVAAAVAAQVPRARSPVE